MIYINISTINIPILNNVRSTLIFSTLSLHKNTLKNQKISQTLIKLQHA